MTLWTEKQVQALNEYQQCGWVHPFTCPNRSEPPHDGEGVLIATTNGWICGSCCYTQTWAHGFMFHGAPPHPFAWRL